MNPLVSIRSQDKIVADAEGVTSGNSFFDLSWCPCFLVCLLLDLEEVVTLNDLEVSIVILAQAHLVDYPEKAEECDLD